MTPSSTRPGPEPVSAAVLRPSDRHPVRLLGLGLLGLGASFLLAACSGGSGGGSPAGGGAGGGSTNAAPTVNVLQPAADVSLARGLEFTLQFTGNDPEGQGTYQVFADGDGDPNTVADRFTLVEESPLTNDVLVEHVLSTSGLPSGAWRILVAVADGSNPAVTGTAPGQVTVENVAWATNIGGLNNDSIFGLDILGDGTAVVTGHFRGSTLLGSGEPNETILNGNGESDIYLASFDASGFLNWALSVGGPGFDKGRDVDTFPDGSMVVTGFFSGQVTFGAGEANETLLTGSGEDVFIARYGADGSLQWATSAGGAGFEEALAVEALDDGTCIVTGYFGSDITFGAGEANETSYTSAGGDDFFVARYDTDGTLLWAKRAGSLLDIQGQALTLLSDGKAVVTGAYLGEATFGNLEPNETVLMPEGSADVFLACFDLDGSLQWAVSSGGPDLDAALGVTAVSNDNIILSGAFLGSATFGKGQANETLLTSNGEEDIFYGCWDSSGQLLWVRGLGGTGSDVSRAAVALEDGSFAVTGLFSDTVTIGDGPDAVQFTADGFNDSFVATFDHQGEMIWAARAGGSDKDGAFAIKRYPDGSIGLVGRYAGTVTFGKDEEHETTLTAIGDRDSYVARFNPDGSF